MQILFISIKMGFKIPWFAFYFIWKSISFDCGFGVSVDVDGEFPHFVNMIF